MIEMYYVCFDFLIWRYLQFNRSFLYYYQLWNEYIIFLLCYQIDHEDWRLGS